MSDANPPLDPAKSATPSLPAAGPPLSPPERFAELHGKAISEIHQIALRAVADVAAPESATEVTDFAALASTLGKFRSDLDGLGLPECKELNGLRNANTELQEFAATMSHPDGDVHEKKKRARKFARSVTGWRRAAGNLAIKLGLVLD